MCTVSPQMSKLNLTPLKAKLHKQFVDPCDLPSPVLKSNISATTMDSPLVSPRKSYCTDTEAEGEEVCSSFHEQGCCSLGSDCEFEHAALGQRWKRSFMLENYPELMIAKPSRRTGSFLC